MIQIKLIYKIEIDSQTQKTNLWLSKGKADEERINKDFGISRNKLLYIKEINKILLYSPENYIEYTVVTHNEKENICN